jgi:hypothetical protein
MVALVLVLVLPGGKAWASSSLNKQRFLQVYLPSAVSAADHTQQQARHLKYMSFYSGCNSTAASEMSGWSNLCLTGNLTNLKRAKQLHGIGSALYLMDAQNMLVQAGCYFDSGATCKRDPAITPANGWGIYRRPPSACVANATCLMHWDGLAPRWQETITRILATAATHGIALDAILLADEICDAGVPVANLSSVASFVRSVVGVKVALWTNEGASAFANKAAWQPSLITKVPAALDMISVDMYVTPNGDTTAESEASETFAFYEKYVYPALRPTQSVLMVPGLFGCRPGILFHGKPIDWGFCNDSIAKQDPHITAKLMAYYHRALTDVRVAGFCPVI